LEVEGGYAWTTESGYFCLAGQVRNSSDQWLEAVKIVATYYDQAGGMVGSDFAYTEMDHVAPRDVGVFHLGVETSDLSGEVATYELQAQARPGNTPPCQGLEVSIANEYMRGEYYMLEGQVRNNGAESCEAVKIVAGFYNSNGGVVGTDFAYTDMDVVPAGGQSPFTLGTDELPGYDHYQVWIQGRPTE
jgi:hypothetical protein